MNYGVFIRLKPIKEENFFREIYEKIWEVLVKNTQHYATTKASRNIANDYLQECFFLSYYEKSDSSIYYVFSGHDGRSCTSARLSMHWITLSLKQLYDVINKQINKLGYVFDSDVSNLETYTSDTLFIEIDNKICQLYSGNELLTDDGTIDLGTLSKKDRVRIEDMIETGLCQCPMCLGIRDGKAPVKFRINSLQKFKMSIYEDLKTALCHPESVQELTIYEDDNCPLTGEIEKFTSIEYLSIYQSTFSHLPKEIGRLKTLTSLSINTEQLQQLPEEISHLINLKRLYLEIENAILPESLGQLANLEILDLRRYKNEILPESYGQLVNLKELNLAYGREKEFPSFIYKYKHLNEFSYVKSKDYHQTIEAIDCSRLSNLEILTLKSPSLTRLPQNLQSLRRLKSLFIGGRKAPLKVSDEIYELKALKSLSITTDEKFEISDKITQLMSLERLNLDYCRNLIQLPEVLGECKNIIEMGVDFSSIKSLPDSIGQLSDLEELSLGCCKQIYTLPDTLGNCKNLKTLLLCESSVKQLPDTMKDCHSLEIVSVTKNTEQAKNILRQRDEWKMDFDVYCY